jgi:flagellar biosynthetic protein FliR
MTALAGLVDASSPLIGSFSLVLARVAGATMMAPVLGSRAVPLRVRAAISVAVAAVVLPVVAVPEALRGGTPPGMALLVALAIETVIGLAIGLVGQLLFAGVLLAGELAGVEMGLGLSGLVDPQTQARTTPIAEWQNLIAILVFLAVDAHHVLLRAVAESFERVPLGAMAVSGRGLALVLALAGQVFVVALKIAAPVLVLVLMSNVAMGALARLIPQLNVMAVGFPVNVLAGFLALALAQPTVIRILTSAFAGWSATLAALLGALG